MWKRQGKGGDREVKIIGKLDIIAFFLGKW